MSHATPQPKKNDARQRAARGFFEKAGLAVYDDDPACWKVVVPAMPGTPQRDFLFFPGSGHWRRPNGTPGYGGAAALLVEIGPLPGDPPKPAKA